MKRITGMLVFSLLSPFAAANHMPMPLDQVIFQVSAKEWVSTQSALLTVNVNATLNNADLVKARADIMDRLNKIANGEWHLTQFNRSQDSSGLEKLFVEAQARVSQSSLTNIYLNAKDVSRPGATYSVTGVEFKPSLQEVQQVKSQLRERLYKQVNDELSTLNKVYPSQNYSVSQLMIIDADNPPPTEVYQARKMNVQVLAAMASPAPVLTVSNELTMTAMVIAGSTRQGSGRELPDKQ
ncbi:hypothetical protein [Legionella sp. CNM-4043-24]|uniref:hypothetical protein n=1 Tax=Legionella sp. CNM-4043-24 TaxID=3421646 RepID=UPI00403ACA72